MRKTVIFIFLIFLGCNVDLTEENNNPENVFDALWSEIDRHYSFFSYSQLNWDSVYFQYKEKVYPGMPDDDLFYVFTEIIDLLGDAHTNIISPKGIGGSNNYFQQFEFNEINDISTAFDYFYTEPVFNYGKIKDKEIGYIKIKTFNGDLKNFKKIDSLLLVFSSFNNLIIDVRSNLGGKISNGEFIISRFAFSSIFAGKYRLRNGPGHEDFSEWIDFYTSKDESIKKYNFRIAVLTNRGSYSATEWFVMMADVLPDFTIIGDTTGGGSSRPILRELPNGWLLRISNSQALLPDGRDFQLEGIYPDIPVWLEKEDYFNKNDRILNTAVNYLLNQ